MNFEEIKGKLGELKSKYQEGIKEYSDSKVYKQLKSGIEAIEEVKSLNEELSDKIDEGNAAIRGTIVLARGRSGDEDKESLEGLRKIYEGERGIFKALGSYITRNKYPSLRDALNVIGKIAERIPSYIERLSGDVYSRKEDLISFKDELRNNIENMVCSISPLEQDIKELDEMTRTLKAEYNSLERQRADNSSNRIKNPPELLQRILLTELSLEQLKDQRTELEVRKRNIDNNIDLSNNQVKKVGELVDLLNQTQETVQSAKDFVDIQVPYVIREINAQKSQIHSLSGVSRAMDFLEGQHQTSGEINMKIKVAAGYLENRVEKIKEEISGSSSIYSTDSGRKKISSKTIENRRILPENKEE
jgi:hypothetical protein